MRIIIILAVILSLFLVSCSVNETTNPPAANTAPQVNATVVQKNTTTPPATTTTAPAQKIACYKNSDCGNDTVNNAYCFQGNPVGDVHKYECENPGTANASCVTSFTSGPIALCGEEHFCYKGACVKYANCTDSDKGLNFTVKGVVKTNDNNIYEDKCDGDIVIEYFCSTDDRAFSEKNDCSGECSKGACVEE